MACSNPITIFMVEDSEVQRMALEFFLSGLKDIKLIGEASDGVSAVEQIVEHKPAIAIVDIGLPLLDGIEVTKQVKQSLPGTCVIMLTAHEGDADIFKAFAAGAEGYVLKGPYTDDYTRTLEMAIRTVHCGSVWLDPGIARRVLDAALALSELFLAVGDKTGASPEPLSAKEKEILDTVARSQGKQEGCLVEPPIVKQLVRFSCV